MVVLEVIEDVVLLFSSTTTSKLLSNLGREQEGGETCLSSSADLLSNTCPSLWAFAPQVLLESFVMGESYLSKARLFRDLHTEGETHLLSMTLVPVSP